MGGTVSCCDSGAPCCAQHGGKTSHDPWLDEAVQITEHLPAISYLAKPSDLGELSQGSAFRVSLSKDQGKKLGIDVEHLEEAPNMPIVAIRGGAAAEWNSAHRGRQLQAGDVVVEVNGVSGSAERMLSTCQRSPRLDMTVIRGGAPKDSMPMRCTTPCREDQCNCGGR